HPSGEGRAGDLHERRTSWHVTNLRGGTDGCRSETPSVPAPAGSVELSIRRAGQIGSHVTVTCPLASAQRHSVWQWKNSALSQRQAQVGFAEQSALRALSV